MNFRLQSISGGASIPEYSEIATGSANKEFLQQSMSNLFSAGPTTMSTSAQIMYPQFHATFKHPARGYQYDSLTSYPQMVVFAEHMHLTSTNNSIAPLYTVHYLNSRMEQVYEKLKADQLFTSMSEAGILNIYMNDLPNSAATKSKINQFCKTHKFRIAEVFCAMPLLFRSVMSFVGTTAAASTGNVEQDVSVSIKADSKVRSLWPKAINGDKLFLIVMPPEDIHGKRSMHNGPPQIYSTACQFPPIEKLEYTDLSGQESIAPVIYIGRKKNDERLRETPLNERIKIVECAKTFPTDLRTISISIDNPWYNSIFPAATVE